MFQEISDTEGWATYARALEKKLEAKKKASAVAASSRETITDHQGNKKKKCLAHAPIATCVERNRENRKER